ncbi:MAG: DUF362 domain-containing protein [Clostridia bacterium]
MSTVSVQTTPDYSAEALDRAIAAHFEALHVAQFLTPATRVLLKPNLLAARDPSLAVTTHPALLLAVARYLHAQGVKKITLADSPGGLYTVPTLRKLYAGCGLLELEKLVTLNEDTSFFERDGFTLIQPLAQADFVINCAKLKTHGLTVMTAGVKNLFGCIPGLRKPELHCIKPTIDSFAEMLLKLSQAVAPTLTLLDAVDCMEGNGPSGGSIRRMGVTLASRDIYALDEQAALLMGLRPITVPTVRLSRTLGLLRAETTLVGDPLTPAAPPFVLPDSVTKGEKLFTPNGLFHRLCGRKTAFPCVITASCIGCGRCAESCPKHIIQIVKHKAVIGRKGCISCFCCQEMCPEHAISVQTGRRSR